MNKICRFGMKMRKEKTEAYRPKWPFVGLPCSLTFLWRFVKHLCSLFHMRRVVNMGGEGNLGTYGATQEGDVEKGRRGREKFA